MKTHFIEQTDQEGNLYNWIAIDEHTARELYESGAELYFVREYAEGRIDNYDDLEEAISFDSVCLDDSYLWRGEFEEGAQNRFRNNDFITFDEWFNEKIESLKC
jgi:hypothetical protein